MVEYTARDWFLFGLYWFVALLAFIGNGFILKVIFKRKKLTNTYKLIANQCFSDGVCGLIYMSLWFFCSTKFLTFANGNGVYVCEVIVIVKVGTFVVSVFTMAAISMDR